MYGVDLCGVFCVYIRCLAASSCYEVSMYVTRVPNRGSPPAILLRESYREGGRVKTRTLANLTRWPEHKVDALARALKGQPPTLELSQAFEITRSLPHGHVAAVLGTAERTGRRRADRCDAVAAAGSGAGPADRGRDRPGLQAGHRARAARRDRHQLPGCRCSACRAVMRTTCMRPWIGCSSVRSASKTPWPPGIWPMGPWCSMTCRRRRSRAAPVRWGRSGMPATGSKAGARSSMGCCARPPGCRWPSRSSTVTPPTPRPWPPKSASSPPDSG